MKNLMLFLCFATLLSSCKNLVPYTDAIRQRHSWGEQELKQIQFYTSDPIVLQRKITEGGTEIISGKIKMVNGEKVEEIIIKEKTPGLLVREASGKFSISFEKSDDYFISFGQNPNMQGRYSIAFSGLKNKVGRINYNGKEYYTAPESVEAILLVDLRKIDKSEVNQRVASGRKIK